MDMTSKSAIDILGNANLGGVLRAAADYAVEAIRERQELTGLLTGQSKELDRRKMALEEYRDKLAQAQEERDRAVRLMRNMYRDLVESHQEIKEYVKELKELKGKQSKPEEEE